MPKPSDSKNRREPLNCDLHRRFEDGKYDYHLGVATFSFSLVNSGIWEIVKLLSSPEITPQSPDDFMAGRINERLEEILCKESLPPDLAVLVKEAHNSFASLIKDRNSIIHSSPVIDKREVILWRDSFRKGECFGISYKIIADFIQDCENLRGCIMDIIFNIEASHIQNGE